MGGDRAEGTVGGQDSAGSESPESHGIVPQTLPQFSLMVDFKDLAIFLP